MAQHPAKAQNHRHFDEPGSQEIVRAIEGAEYPVSKEKLVDLAKRNGADGEIIAVLDHLTIQSYDSEAAVIRNSMRFE